MVDILMLIIWLLVFGVISYIAFKLGSNHNSIVYNTINYPIDSTFSKILDEDWEKYGKHYYEMNRVLVEAKEKFGMCDNWKQCSIGVSTCTQCENYFNWLEERNVNHY